MHENNKQYSSKDYLWGVIKTAASYVESEQTEILIKSVSEF